MAKQVGPQYVTGTIGELTFYKLFEQYYVRTKSSLNRERIKRDRAFERFRRCSSVFGKASSLASVLYWSLPGELRGHGVQGRLTGEFYQLLLSEVSADEAVEVMVKRYLGRREKEGSRAEAQGTQRGDLTLSRQGAKERQEREERRVEDAVERKGQGDLTGVYLYLGERLGKDPETSSGGQERELQLLISPLKQPAPYFSIEH